MTSEPSAELRTSTLGLSAYLTVGERIIGIEWMDSGELGSIRGRGSLEDLLSAISDLYGRYEECMLGTYQVTIQYERESPPASPPFNTSVTLTAKTE
ncbi:hypothetical protein LCGC14_1953790, partial [marine sediment metagenome]